MTVQTISTFTADEIVGVVFECPHCPTTIGVRDAEIADRGSFQCPSCQRLLWAQGVPCRERDFARALLALQETLARNAAHPPDSKPVVVRLIIATPPAGD